MKQNQKPISWIALSYISIFFISFYLMLQFLFTVLFVIIYEVNINQVEKFRINGFQFELDGANMYLWQLPEYYWALMLSSLIIILFMNKLLIWQGNNKPLNYLGLRKIYKKNVIWLIHSLIFSFICFSFWHFFRSGNEMIRLSNFNLELVVVVFSAVVLAPIAEEIIFRGYILVKLNELLHKDLSWISILVTSMLFALIHFQFSLIELAILFFIGIFLSFLKLKTKNLWFPIFFHSFGNLTALFLYHFL